MVKRRPNVVTSDSEDEEQGAPGTDSSDSDSDSDAGETTSRGVAPPALLDTETSEHQLTLVDDLAPSLLIQPIPELDGEDDDGEGDTEEQTERATTTADEGNKTATEGELDGDKPKKKKKKRKKWYYICTNNCKYESVRRVSRRFGFKEVSDEEDWNLYWTDYSVALERVMDMKKYQKINHFPGMSEICRKDLLCRNMNRMLKLFPKEYNVFPRSWCLPADYGDFQAFTRQKKHKTYILKPESGCQGRGIWVTKNPKEIKAHEHQLCQQYLSKPFLIDGFKYDMRIYVLVVSCDPLRIFVFKDGLARFATTKYIEPSHNNVSNVYMHLTNYAINKHSEDFLRDDEGGSKRRLSTMNIWLENHGYDVDKMWRDIDDVIIKTLISAHAILKHNYRTCFPNHIRGSACFEILGFDVMIDKKLKPYLIEVNHSPSFHTDAKLDKEIKEALLFDTMNVVNFGAVDKRKCIEEERRKIKERLFQRQNKKETKEELDRAQSKWLDELARYEDAHIGNFRRIYPAEGTDKYEKYFHSSGSLYQETAAFKARSELARQQREEILRKQEKLEAMLKKKKDLVRPESPGSRRRRVVKRPSMPPRKLNGRSEPFSSNGSASDIYKRDLSLEPVDTLKPLDIVEDEELERISGLLQRDNLVRGLGIVEHVYRLLHCTPGTVGIQLKNDHKYNYSLDDPGGKSAGQLSDMNHHTAGTIFTQNHNNSNSSANRAYQQGALVSNLSQMGTVKVQRGSSTNLGQVNDRSGLQHRTRYTNRKQQSRSGNAIVMPESEYRHQLTLLVKEQNDSNTSGAATQQASGGVFTQQAPSTVDLDPTSPRPLALSHRHYSPDGTISLTNVSHARNQVALSNLLHRSRSAHGRVTSGGQQGRASQKPAIGAKSTPRGGAIIPPVAATPPPHYVAGGQVLPQYQYNFPNMVKVTSAHHPGTVPPLSGTAVPSGLSIVSAPATLANRPEISSAGSSGVRGGTAAHDQNIRHGKLTPGPRVRGVPPKLKDIDIRPNHAVVFS